VMKVDPVRSPRHHAVLAGAGPDHDAAVVIRARPDLRVRRQRERAAGRHNKVLGVCAQTGACDGRPDRNVGGPTAVAIPIFVKFYGRQAAP